MPRLRPAFKMHGGKNYLAPWIIDHFPEGYENMTYLEPFAGAANVFFQKTKSPEEAINDIDSGVVHIFQALRNQPQELIARLKRLKYTEETFLKAKAREKNVFEDYMDHAINQFVIRRMSRGGLRQAFAWSDRQRGGMPGDVNAWNTAIKALPILSERLKDVFIFNKPAIEVIKPFNNAKTLVYCDPPYAHESRVSKDAYEFEMSEKDHVQLSNVLHSFTGKALISGYPCPLYNKLYKDWKCVKKKIANHSSQQKVKSEKTEVLWRNY